MKRLRPTLALLALLVSGLVAATAVAGKSPASILQTTSGATSTTGTTATTGTTGTTTTVTTTTTATASSTRKVTVCHHTRSKKNPHKTLRINSTAWAAHQRHGDTVGACTTTPNIRAHSRTAHVKRWHKGVTLAQELKKERKAAKGKGK